MTNSEDYAGNAAAAANARDARSLIRAERAERRRALVLRAIAWWVRVWSRSS